MSANRVQGEDVPVSLTEEQEKLLQSSLLTAFHHKKEQKDIHRPDTPKEGEGGEKEYASSLDEGQSLVPTGNSLVVSQTSLQDDDAFLLQEEGEDLEETDDNGVPSDLPAFMFTEEQDALLQSSLATAFSRKDEDGHVDKPEEQEESAGGDKLIEAPVGEGLASFTSAHAVPADLFLNDEEHGAHSDLKKNGSFSSSPTAENDVKKQTDSSEGADSQREEGVKTAVSPDVEAVGGRRRKISLWSLLASCRIGKTPLYYPRIGAFLKRQVPFLSSKSLFGNFLEQNRRPYPRLWRLLILLSRFNSPSLIPRSEED